MKQTNDVLDLGSSWHYQLQSLLGRVGLGEVWRAQWLQTQTPVVLKLVDGRSGTTGAQAAARERQVLTQMRGPHVVQCLHAASFEGIEVLVLEPMQISVAAFVQRCGGALPAQLALSWAAQVAQALVGVHACGVRHLDLKPANLMLKGLAGDEGSWHLGGSATAGAIVKLIDFGSCVLAADGPRDRSVSRLGTAWGGAQISDLHDARGTPAWMSPEQALPVGLDARGYGTYETSPASDLFALGLLLFHWLTGQQTELTLKLRAFVLARRLPSDTERREFALRAQVGLSDQDKAHLATALGAQHNGAVLEGLCTLLCDLMARPAQGVGMNAEAALAGLAGLARVQVLFPGKF